MSKKVIEATQKQIAEWKEKAEKWDKLDNEISKFYNNAEGEYDQENPGSKGDLTDIGEVACMAFGYL